MWYYIIIIEEHALSDCRGFAVAHRVIIFHKYMLYTRDDDDNDDRNDFLSSSGSRSVRFFCKYFKLFVIMSKPHSGIYLQHIINTPYVYMCTGACIHPLCRTRRLRYRGSRDQSAVYRTSSAEDYYVYYNISILEIIILFEMISSEKSKHL